MVPNIKEPTSKCDYLQISCIACIFASHLKIYQSLISIFVQYGKDDST